jgi:hypothetical protein
MSKKDHEIIGILRAWSEHKPQKNPQAHHGYEDDLWCLDDECGVDWPCDRWRAAQAFIGLEARIARAEAACPDCGYMLAALKPKESGE